jgi:hypothetical protein
MAGSELATSAVHTATATVLAPVIRMADISLAPDSIQIEHGTATGTVSATGRRSGGEHHVGPIRKFASAGGRLSPPHERAQVPDRHQI